MEVKTALKLIPYQYRYFCDLEDCDGEVVYQNMDKLSNPRQCIHKCKKCRQEYLFFKQYPRIEEEIEVQNS